MMHWFWRVVIAFIVVTGFEIWYVVHGWSRLWKLAYESVFRGDMPLTAEASWESMAATAVASLPVLLVALVAYGVLSYIFARGVIADGETHYDKGGYVLRGISEIRKVTIFVLSFLTVATLLIGTISFVKPIYGTWVEDGYPCHIEIKQGVLEYVSGSSWPEFINRKVRIPRVIWYCRGFISIALWVPLVLFAIYPVTAFLRSRSPYRRYRGHGTRCRKCGYILKGITEPRCPECGEKI